MSKADQTQRLLDRIGGRYTASELRAIADGSGILSRQFKIPAISFEGQRIRFGAMTDTHLGSVDFIPAYFDAAIKAMNQLKCEFIIHSGDVTEGMSNRPDQIYTLTHIGYHRQRQHAIDIMSQWEKKWYLVSGNHDRWFIKSNGADIVQDIADGLPDGEMLGHDEGDLVFNGRVKLRLWHGEDTSSYAISYRLQKLVESFTGGEKPQVLFAGHTHKAGYFFIRNIHTFGGGALSKQSRWMRSKRLENHAGFWVIDVWVGKRGVLRIQMVFHPFYS